MTIKIFYSNNGQSWRVGDKRKQVGEDSHSDTESTSSNHSTGKPNPVVTSALAANRLALLGAKPLETPVSLLMS